HSPSSFPLPSRRAPLTFGDQVAYPPHHGPSSLPRIIPNLVALPREVAQAAARLTKGGEMPESMEQRQALQSEMTAMTDRLVAEFAYVHPAGTVRNRTAPGGAGRYRLLS